MYYRLKEPWSFRGWKKLPYAVSAMYGEKKHEMPVFLDKSAFVELLYCNGKENVNPDDLSERTRQIIRDFIAKGMIEESEIPLPPLAPWQRYIIYPSRYLEGAHWSITGKCNFQCRHCMVSAPSARHPQLPLKDCLRIVDSIAQCGIKHVDITGGEPLVRSDFEEIVKALTAYNIDIGTLFTNASLLSRDTMEMLHRHNQHPTFQLSFDGLGYHDWLRGVPGAEKQADEGFRLLQSYGARVSAAMCIHRKNKDSLRATVNYLA
ncbi:MAG: radical SAM protein [Solobacterium sp.]|nr:radical SAM protein [Solobacterium sp.]